MKTVVSEEVATAEVDRWIESKFVSEKKKQANAYIRELLIDAVMNGNIIIHEDNTITQKLNVPIMDKDGNPYLSEIKYKARLTIGEANDKLKGISPTDYDNRVLAYAAALTSQPLGIMRKMDSSDNSISDNIVAFFK